MVQTRRRYWAGVVVTGGGGFDLPLLGWIHRSTPSSPLVGSTCCGWVLLSPMGGMLVGYRVLRVIDGW